MGRSVDRGRTSDERLEVEMFVQGDLGREFRSLPNNRFVLGRNRRLRHPGAASGGRCG